MLVQNFTKGVIHLHLIPPNLHSTLQIEQQCTNQTMRFLRIKRLGRIIVTICVILIIIAFKTLLELGEHRVRIDLRAIQGLELISEKFIDKHPVKIRQRFLYSYRTPQHFILENATRMTSYTLNSGITTCLKFGTRYLNYGECICRKDWLGKSCNIPKALYYSYSMKSEERRRIRLRSGTARRIIYATLFNHEFITIETLLHELYDLVDVFIFLESTFTAYGIRKPLRLLPKLYRGYLRKFAPKIMYLCLDHFPTGGRKIGWIADSYLRGSLGRIGLPNIHNLSNEDLFLVFDIDEIPTREYLAFLKFHDGYPEPFGLRLRWSIFGYFWKNDRPTQVTVGCTIEMLKQVFNNDSNLIRAIHVGLDPKVMPNLENYKKTHSVSAWFMGEGRYLAGWHCSSCFKPEDIRIKYMSAQNADHPRWGSIPEKMNLTFIRNMVRDGVWFDGGKVPLAKMDTDSMFAPEYLLQNFDTYKYILVNPYKKET